MPASDRAQHRILVAGLLWQDRYVEIQAPHRISRWSESRVTSQPSPAKYFHSTALALGVIARTNILPVCHYYRTLARPRLGGACSSQPNLTGSFASSSRCFDSHVMALDASIHDTRSVCTLGIKESGRAPFINIYQRDRWGTWGCTLKRLAPRCLPEKRCQSEALSYFELPMPLLHKPDAPWSCNGNTSPCFKRKPLRLGRAVCSHDLLLMAWDICCMKRVEKPQHDWSVR